jgi:hypothetical protein
MHFYTRKLRLGKIRQAVIAYSEKFDINDAKIAKKTTNTFYGIVP